MILNEIPTAQTEKQIVLFHRIIKSFRIATFIELGAFMGGLTYELITKYPEMIIHSFDLGGYLNEKVINRPEMHLMDVFHPDTVEYIRGLINASPGPVLLFCDNGNKIAEFELYYPLLRDGDLIQVHDYPDECTPEFVTHVLRDYSNLEPINLDLYLENGTIIWKKIVVPDHDVNKEILHQDYELEIGYMKAIIKCVNCGFGVVVLNEEGNGDAEGTCTRCGTKHTVSVSVTSFEVPDKESTDK